MSIKYACTLPRLFALAQNADCISQ